MGQEGPEEAGNTKERLEVGAKGVKGNVVGENSLERKSKMREFGEGMHVFAFHVEIHVVLRCVNKNHGTLSQP